MFKHEDPRVLVPRLAGQWGVPCPGIHTPTRLQAMFDPDCTLRCASDAQTKLDKPGPGAQWQMWLGPKATTDSCYHEFTHVVFNTQHLQQLLDLHNAGHNSMTHEFAKVIHGHEFYKLMQEVIKRDGKDPHDFAWDDEYPHITYWARHDGLWTREPSRFEKAWLAQHMRPSDDMRSSGFQALTPEEAEASLNRKGGEEQ